MSDSTRKDFTEQVSSGSRRPSLVVHVTEWVTTTYERANSGQAKETVTPDSQKSTLDKASETVTGKADNLAGSLQPQEEKSTAQKIGDSTKDTSNQAGEQVGHRRIPTA